MIILAEFISVVTIKPVPGPDPETLAAVFQDGVDRIVAQAFGDFGDVLVDGSATDRGELALGQNVLCAFMAWEGYNFEDAIVVSERLVREDVFTSIHVDEYLLEVRDLTVRFPLPRQRLLSRREYFRAVEAADVTLAPGETLGVVGESGCGKSSLARAVLRLLPASEGRVVLLGRALDRLGRAEMRAARRDLQLVFQDPLGSLDPRMPIGEIVAEPLLVHERGLSRADRRERVAAMLERVGLGPETLARYPHELSGGQCQRAGIARALVTRPRLLICDEAVSALDVSVQAGILDLLLSLQREMGLAILFIAHDLAVVRRVSHRVMVMYLGRIVERNGAGELYARPRHPYTRALLDAVPVPDPEVERRRAAPAAARDLPVPWDPPGGCAYRTRCPWAVERCAAERPALASLAGGEVACHRADELDLSLRMPGAPAAAGR